MVARLVASDPAVVRETATEYRYLSVIEHHCYATDTALHIAAGAHNADIVGALIAAGASVDARNRRGAQSLHYAADGLPHNPVWDGERQKATVTVLLRAGADPNAFDKDGVAPLHRAVRTRCAEAVHALLIGGADPRLVSGRGSSPMDLAVRTTGRGGSGTDIAKEQQSRIIELLS